ncbi:hypothetical protein DFR41_110174 [Pseudacidovorax intermedius]|uniref:MetS family NSS transporter small subunit n=1 Tax=Pseudacidovorax intermedius TaxID=433924 RepID=A0A370F8B6_9BURK|nr:hypothetical protein DFR41_110174 [Pseudacidovorax intermedius]
MDIVWLAAIAALWAGMVALVYALAAMERPNGGRP